MRPLHSIQTACDEVLLAQICRQEQRIPPAAHGRALPLGGASASGSKVAAPSPESSDSSCLPCTPARSRTHAHTCSQPNMLRHANQGSLGHSEPGARPERRLPLCLPLVRSIGPCLNWPRHSPSRHQPHDEMTGSWCGRWSLGVRVGCWCSCCGHGLMLLAKVGGKGYGIALVSPALDLG